MLTLLVLAPGEGWQVSFQLLESLEQGRKNHLGGCSIKLYLPISEGHVLMKLVINGIWIP